MRRVFAGDVAEWLSGALFLFGSLGHDGRIDVDVADLEDVDAANPDEFEPSEPERSVQPFTPGLTGAVGVGFEVALLSHYSLLFQLGYGPAVDLYPFKLRFFGLSFTFGTGIRF
jgi:hypothetical protein